MQAFRAKLYDFENQKRGEFNKVLDQEMKLGGTVMRSGLMAGASSIQQSLSATSPSITEQLEKAKNEIQKAFEMRYTALNTKIASLESSV